MALSRTLAGLAGLSAVALCASASAQPVGPAMPGWEPMGTDRWNAPQGHTPRQDRSREGRVDVTRFVAGGEAAAALGHGAVAVTAADGSLADARARDTFEAAVIDQLVKAGYETAAPDPDGGQIAEVRVLRREIEPAEPPRKPVSGEMTVGVSNRGSMMGMAVAVDMTKPLKALVSTRLEARIRDRVSGETLWEGHAAMATRDGDPDWTDQAIAHRLAEALFRDFPGKSGESYIVP
ncbi:MAG: hypothetical protein PHE36_10715 [Novosphingobium sp.]|nr:hypothetical protein [Novosphingobium sp.]